jgi:hypothetical protein
MWIVPIVVSILGVSLPCLSCVLDTSMVATLSIDSISTHHLDLVNSNVYMHLVLQE